MTAPDEKRVTIESLIPYIKSGQLYELQDIAGDFAGALGYSLFHAINNELDRREQNGIV